MKYNVVNNVGIIVNVTENKVHANWIAKQLNTLIGQVEVDGDSFEVVTG